MICSAITVCVVPESRSGPFVFQDGFEAGLAHVKAHGFDAVESLPSHTADHDGLALRNQLRAHVLQLGQTMGA